MGQNQYEQTGFWQPHDDRRDTAQDFTRQHQHTYQTWEGNRYVQRCRCGDWYRTDNPGQVA